MNAIIVSGCDRAYFPSAHGLIRSLRRFGNLAKYAIGFLDFGLEEAQRQWLAEQGVEVKPAGWDIDFPSRSTWEASLPWFKNYLCRTNLPRHFPGYESYLWLDADCWVQQSEAVEQLLAATAQGGLAATPQLDRSYRNFVNLRQQWQNDYQIAAYCLGEELAQKFACVPTFNAGVFALHRNAPHWDAWRHYLQLGLNRVDPKQQASRLLPHVAFGAAVYLDAFGMERFPSTHHWLAALANPAWDVAANRFVEPSPPHAPIGIVHFSGLNPRDFGYVRIIHEGAAQVTLNCAMSLDAQLELAANQPQLLADVQRRAARSASVRAAAARETDYVSPGLTRVAPDACFPNMMVGDKSGCLWNYLRREVPHRWYVDRRVPGIGFLNRDEAHILYNIALAFRGRRTLEVGCWMGWSTCHLALAGVILDVVDPALGDARVRGSVEKSLAAADVLGRVNLVAGESPAAVRELAQRENRKWSLFFVDGDHEGAAPRSDTVECEQYAEPDAAFVFHDLASPHVAAGLRYLHQRGWQTRVYQTMQIMGVAWRGDVVPLDHVADPGVQWSLPEHLRDFPIAGHGTGG